MSVRALKFKIEGINTFENHFLEIDFFSEQNVRKESISNYEVTPLFSNIYSLNSIVFTGINASGKTTSLLLIQFILNTFLNGVDVNQELRTVDKKGWLQDFFDKELTISAYFASNQSIFCIKSTLIKKEDNVKGPIIFFDEELYVKDINQTMTKKQVFEVGKPLLTRNNNSDYRFLPREISFFKYYLSEIEGIEPVMNYINSLIYRTDFNVLTEQDLDNIPMSLIRYLDSSIEHLEIIHPPQSDRQLVELKFINKPMINTDVSHLSAYLSSGTIRGLLIYIEAFKALNTGGYLIVDELENHLNKHIVYQLISLFNSSINKNGASLIFSTHYAELIDTVPRNDAVYLLIKDASIRLEKLSKQKNNRSDIKKSARILSGELNTVPKFKYYTEWREKLRSKLNLNPPKYKGYSMVKEDNDAYSE